MAFKKFNFFLSIYVFLLIGYLSLAAPQPAEPISNQNKFYLSKYPLSVLFFFRQLKGYSPFGILQLLNTVHIFEPSAEGLNEKFLKSFNEKYTNENFYSVNVYSYRNAVKGSKELNDAGFKFVKDNATFKQYVKTVTNGVKEDSELPFSNSLIFINIFAPKLKWIKSGQVHKQIKGYMFTSLRNKGSRFINNIEYEGIKTSYANDEKFEAFKLNLINNHIEEKSGGSVESSNFAIYIIQKKGKFIFYEYWTRIFEKLSSLNEEEANVRLPMFRIHQNIDLSKGNDYFDMTMKKKNHDDFVIRPYVEQQIEVCVDKLGINVIDSEHSQHYDTEPSKENKMLKTGESPSGNVLKKPIQFSSTFLFVIADTKNQVPVFAAQIDTEDLLPFDSDCSKIRKNPNGERH
ncbi:hypothetical protein HMI54_012293 [Coelomomyces lativittatus]|nr:hypothetical protein HMI56_004949 [Coelomomyces lativittatus]KAJ1498889.1 hypothetical protein HMI54_012293 [Coelomomyces lativittatus]